MTTIKGGFSLTNKFKTRNEFLSYIKSLEIVYRKSNTKIEYGNIACTIDLETSSFYNERNEKTAIMYAGTIGISGSQYLFRTYKELENILYDIIDILELNEKKRLIF